MKNFFGTDGVRGIANEYPITAEFALKVSKVDLGRFKKTKQDWVA